MDKREKVAKWLASVIENGEPYDDFGKMEWSEFAGGEEHAESFRELAGQVISIILPEDKPPLLSDGFLQSIKTKVFNPFKYYEDDEHLRNYSQLDGLREVAQAQREVDIKFYTEELADA